MQPKKLLMGAVAALALGAAARDADDQIRYSGYVPSRHDALVEMGFNLFSMPLGVHYNFAAEKSSVPKVEAQKALYARLAGDDAEGLIDYCIAGNGYLREKFPRRGADGQPITRVRGEGGKTTNVDAALPGCRAAIENGAKAVGATCAELQIPNLVSFRGLEEVRLSSFPSLDETARAAYRTRH